MANIKIPDLAPRMGALSGDELIEVSLELEGFGQVSRRVTTKQVAETVVSASAAAAEAAAERAEAAEAEAVAQASLAQSAADASAVSAVTAQEQADIAVAAAEAAADIIAASSGLTAVVLATLDIPVEVAALVLVGWDEPGDFGAAVVFDRSETEPSHLGKIQSADGAWWEYTGETTRVQCFRYGLPSDGWFSAAFQSAVDFTAPNGGVITLPRGEWEIDTTIDLTNLYTSNLANLPVNHTKRLLIEGAGSANTRLTGGEEGYGFLEIIGSCFIDFKGFSIASTRDANLPQYGILGGRPTGDASSGFFYFDDIVITGAFTKPAWFMMSDEVNIYDRCIVYPTIRDGMILAVDNYGWDMDPKYAALGNGIGGNGVNSLNNCDFLSAADAEPDACLFAAEGTQVLNLDECYFASSTNERQIMLRKSGAQPRFTNCQFEKYGSFDPFSIYIEGDDPLDPTDNPDYRDITVEGCRLFSLYAEDGVRITALNWNNNQFRNADGDYGIDVPYLYDSIIKNSPRLANFTQNETVKVRIRNGNAGNQFNGFAVDRIEAPFPALDNIALTATDEEAIGQNDYRYGIDTTPGAAVTLSGIHAQIDAGSVPGTAAFSMMLEFTVPNVVDGNVRLLFGLGTSASNLSGTNTISAYLQNGRLLIRSLGGGGTADKTDGTVDTSFVSQFAGKRVQLLIVRDGATMTAYINGFKSALSNVASIGGRAWSDTIDGNYLLVGFQNSSTTTNASTVYHSAALFNYAVGYAKALSLAQNGLTSTDMWGSVFGGGTNGCIGYWDFSGGGGTVVADSSTFLQDGATSGTVSRIQASTALNAYRTNAGTPVGSVVPRYIGEELLNTSASQWFKATGLTSADWAQLN